MKDFAEPKVAVRATKRGKSKYTLLRSYVAIRTAKHKRKRVLLCVLSL